MANKTKTLLSWTLHSGEGESRDKIYRYFQIASKRLNEMEQGDGIERDRDWGWVLFQTKWSRRASLRR